MGLKAKRPGTAQTQQTGGNTQMTEAMNTTPAQPTYNQAPPAQPVYNQAPPAQPQYEQQPVYNQAPPEAPAYYQEPQYQAPPAQPVYEQAPQYQQAPPAQQQYEQQPMNQQAPPQYAPPAQQQYAPPAVPQGANAMADMNAGILDNIDDMNIGGNYVTMDGSEFLYKATDETAQTIEAVITYGKRFYQWFDEDNQQYNNSDTKLDDRYKLKFELRWFEDVDGQPQEHIMSLPTASAMTFITYVKGLSKLGLGVGQVVTRFSISRQENKKMNIRYSRTEFEMVPQA